MGYKSQFKSECCNASVIDAVDKKSEYMFDCTKCKKGCGVVRIKDEKSEKAPAAPRE